MIPPNATEARLINGLLFALTRRIEKAMKKSLIIKISLVIAFVVIAVVGIILMTNSMRCTPPCV